MNKTKKIILGLGTLALVLGITGAITNTADAYKGDPKVKGPNYSEERHSAMQKALETNDYNAWKTLMEGKGRVTEVINQDNFAKFAEAYKLALKGDMAGAEKIRQELGLNQGQGMKGGLGKGMNNGMHNGMHKGFKRNK
jgi:hypothetical protein